MSGPGIYKIVEKEFYIIKKKLWYILISHVCSNLIMLYGLGIGLGMFVGSPQYFGFLVPGLTLQVIAWITTFMYSFPIFETLNFTKSIEEEIVSPLSHVDIIIGRVLIGGLISVLLGAILPLLSIPFGFAINTSFWLFGIVYVLVGLLTGMLFASLALVVASLSRSTQVIDIYVSVVINFMTIMGGVYFPIELMPESVKLISQALPLYHSVNILRNFSNLGSIEMASSLIILIAYLLVAIVAAIFCFRKRVLR